MIDKIKKHLGQAAEKYEKAHKSRVADDFDKAHDDVFEVLRCSFNAPALGLDLDGTITEHPEFFSTLSRVWPGKVYIITFRADHAHAVFDATRHGIRFDEVILSRSLESKAEIIAEKKIKIFFDDMDEVLNNIPDGVAVFKVRNGGNFEDGKWLYDSYTGKHLYESRQL